MGLISKTAIVKWGKSNKKHYLNKGYIFTNYGDEFETRVEDLTNSSPAKVLIKCDCEDCENPFLPPMKWVNYKRYVNKNDIYYCNLCATSLFAREKQNATKLKKSKSFEQWCIGNNRQDVLDRWDYDLNKLKPNEILFGSRKKYYFKCSRNIHKSELKCVNDFTQGHEYTMNCKQCNSFAQYLIDTYGNTAIEKYWSSKNTVSPWEISKSSPKTMVWIKCHEKEYHKEYIISCNSFSVGRRCTYCSGKKVHPKDSLGQYIVDNYGEEFLNSVWSDRNVKSAFEYSPNSNKKVWWKCTNEMHRDYKRAIDNSNRYKFRCSNCVRERNESYLQEKVRLYIDKLGYTILHEHKTLKCINFKTNYQLPYDNEIKELKLIIEVHGIQHYKINSWHNNLATINDTTSKEEFEYQKWKDQYKKDYALSQGYYYLEIPYFSDNAKEEWKKAIDNKINEIKGSEK